MSKQFSIILIESVKTLSISIVSIFSLANISANAQQVAQPAPVTAGQPAFVKMQELIFSYAGLIGSFLIIPIGVLALVVNIVQLIWQLMTGETHGIGKKLGWILFLILLTGFGVWLAANARIIF